MRMLHTDRFTIALSLSLPLHHPLLLPSALHLHPSLTPRNNPTPPITQRHHMLCTCPPLSPPITTPPPITQGFKPTSGRIERVKFQSTANVWGYFSVGANGV